MQAEIKKKLNSLLTKNGYVSLNDIYIMCGDENEDCHPKQIYKTLEDASDAYRVISDAIAKKGYVAIGEENTILDAENDEKHCGIQSFDTFEEAFNNIKDGYGVNYDDTNIVIMDDEMFTEHIVDRIDMMVECDYDGDYNAAYEDCKNKALNTDYLLDFNFFLYSKRNNKFYTSLMEITDDAMHMWSKRQWGIFHELKESYDFVDLIESVFAEYDDSDDAEDEDDGLTIGSREEMVGVPLAGIPFGDFDLKITPEEAERLNGEIEVAIYTGGPYFSSRDAAVKWTGALDVDNLTLNLYKPLYEYHDALYWEKKDYDHNFEDFVIEVFDMKITKGKVTIHIELGS